MGIDERKNCINLNTANFWSRLNEMVIFIKTFKVSRKDRASGSISEKWSSSKSYLACVCEFCTAQTRILGSKQREPALTTMTMHDFSSKNLPHTQRTETQLVQHHHRHFHIICMRTKK